MFVGKWASVMTLLSLYLACMFFTLIYIAQSPSVALRSCLDNVTSREDRVFSNITDDMSYRSGTVCDSFNISYVFNDSDPCCLKGLLHPSFSAHALQRFRKSCDQVWYNKCMKSASTLVRTVLSRASRILGNDMCLKNYSLYHSNMYFKSDKMLDRAHVFASSSTYRPCIDMFHHYLVPFKKAGVRQPLIINVVRHPLARLLSHYIFISYHMGDFAKQRLAQNVTPGSTLRDCAEGRGKLHQCKSFFGYFCDDVELCNGSRSRNTTLLPYTKRVIEEYGIIIGLTEDLPSFWELLEHLSPRFFRGVAEDYSKNPDMVRHVTDNTEIHNAIQLNSTQVKELPDLLAPEIQLYEFIRQRFYLIKDKVVKLSQQLVTSDQQIM